MAKKPTKVVPGNLNKQDWKNEHLQYKHEGYDYYFAWCPLCVNKYNGDTRQEEWNKTDLSIGVSDGIVTKDGLV